MRKYTDDEKSQAIESMIQHNWDVPLVSLELNIPERTLYRWKSQWQKKVIPLPQFPSSFGERPQDVQKQLEASHEQGEYTELREILMQHIKTLAPTISEDPDLAHRRVLALSRLLDKVLKLEDLVQIEKPQIHVLKYETDDGYLHDRPYYYNGLHERAKRAYNAVIENARYKYLKQQGYSDEDLHFMEDGTMHHFDEDVEEGFEYGDEATLNAIFAEPLTDDILHVPQDSGYFGEEMAQRNGFGTIDSDATTATTLPPKLPENDTDFDD